MHQALLIVNKYYLTNIIKKKLNLFFISFTLNEKQLIKQ